jgi:hypothetical protein
MSNSLRRLAPLTGIPFAVLLAYSFFGAPSSPSVKDSGAQVLAHYQAHHTGHIVGDLIGGLAIVFFLFFITYLRTYFRSYEGGDGLSLAAYVGGIFIAIGGALFSCIDFALASDRNHLTPAGANVLNVMNDSFFVPFEIGLIVFALCTGLTIIATGALPKWMGWLFVVIGVVAFSPIGFFGFFVIMLWSIVVSIMLYRRQGTGAGRPVAGGPTPAATGGTP